MYMYNEVIVLIRLTEEKKIRHTLECNRHKKKRKKNRLVGHDRSTNVKRLFLFSRYVFHQWHRKHAIFSVTQQSTLTHRKQCE